MRLHRIETRVFEEGLPFSSGAAARWMEHYTQDITGLYGLAPRPGHLLKRRNSYADMVAAMLEIMAPVPAAMEVVAMATAVPDADLQQAPISMLADALLSDPLPLGASEQGPIAPFTALELIQLYDTENALLMVLDQRSLPYDVTGPEEVVPLQDCAVALLFTEDGGCADDFAIRHWVDVPPVKVADLLAGERDGGATLIAGAGLAKTLPSGFPDMRVAPLGLPCTGAWTELAVALPGLRGRSVTVADYDHALRHLSTCTLHID